MSDGSRIFLVVVATVYIEKRNKKRRRIFSLSSLFLSISFSVIMSTLIMNDKGATIEPKEYVVPTPNDVLSGRTKMVRDHPGTVLYRTYVERNQAEYEVASSFQKTALAYLIMKLITDAGGRFLKFDGDGWLEMDVHATRQKISHCFRSINGRKKPKVRKWVTLR